MGRPKKYQTEEERKAANRERSKRWKRNNKAKNAEHKKQYYQKHKEEIAEYMAQYHQEHKEERAEYNKQWYQDHKKEKTEYNKQYYNTPMGRALGLLQGYRSSDKIAGRGDCTIPNAQWIMENIFTKKCAHCEETDWHKLGCNRLDNSLPHTPDNVEPCCFECNNKQPRKNP